MRGFLAHTHKYTSTHNHIDSLPFSWGQLSRCWDEMAKSYCSSSSQDYKCKLSFFWLVFIVRWWNGARNVVTTTATSSFQAEKWQYVFSFEKYTSQESTRTHYLSCSCIIHLSNAQELFHLSHKKRSSFCQERCSQRRDTKNEKWAKFRHHATCDVVLEHISEHILGVFGSPMN